MPSEDLLRETVLLGKWQIEAGRQAVFGQGSVNSNLGVSFLPHSWTDQLTWRDEKGERWLSSGQSWRL